MHAHHTGIKWERIMHLALENKAEEKVRVGKMCVPCTKEREVVSVGWEEE